MYYKTRSRFSNTDFQFIAKTLARSDKEKEAILSISDDPVIVNHLLRREELFRTILDNPSALISISSGLYFYTLIYHALNFKKIADDDVADYVSGVCVDFTDNQSLWRYSTDATERMIYFVDLHQVMNDYNEVQQYQLHQYIGNAALFLTGFFPDLIYRREKLKGAPPIEYYESMGYTHYEAAANASMQYESSATPVLFKLSGYFTEVRSAINMFVDAYLKLHSEKGILDRIERQSSTLDEESFKQTLLL